MDNPWTKEFLKVELPLQNVSHRHRQLVLHIGQDLGYRSRVMVTLEWPKASDTIFA